jgi:hypothetical protein
MDERFKDTLRRFVLGDEEDKLDPEQIVERALDEVLGTFERAFKEAEPGQFVGSKTPDFKQAHGDIIYTAVDQYFPKLPSGRKDQILELLKEILLSDYLSQSLTGIVVAGFGKDDRFPTLVAYEIDGVAIGGVKQKRIHHCDIDRDGERASVIPFAQKEMVERFLYGLDDEIVNEITSFARRTISTIGDTIRPNLEFGTDDGAQHFTDSIQAAEEAFVDGLRTSAFEAIRDKSKRAIDIVEFMPKPEWLRRLLN